MILRNASETGFSSEKRIFITEGFVCETVCFPFKLQNKGTTTKTSPDSCRFFLQPRYNKYITGCFCVQLQLYKKTDNRHLFALQNVSLRECISIIHVSECVSKQGKKKKKKKRGGSFCSFQFISTNGFQASSHNQAAAAWSMHQRGREEMRIPSRDAKNSRHSAIQLLPCIRSKTQTQNCALKSTYHHQTTILNAVQTN